MRDLDDVRDLHLRFRLDALDPRRLDRAAQEDGQLEALPLRTHEEIARRPREHDAAARRVDALLAELDRGFTQPRVGVLQIFGQILRQRRFGRGPAVVRLAFCDPLLAVVTLVRLSSPHFAVRRLREEVGRRSWPHSPMSSRYSIAVSFGI